MIEREAMGRGEGDPIRFGRGFVQSEAFKALFQEGMSLVEEAAAYLDGPGREDSRGLPGPIALTYATESMRLTTRLMQVASWLLVQRGLAEGDLSSDQARQERSRLRLTTPAPSVNEADFDRLPAGLLELVGLAARLHARVLHLDLLLTDGEPEAAPEAPVRESRGPSVAAQQELIQRAFGDLATV